MSYKNEWSMGNGQCPDCCGSAPNMGWWTQTVGHKKNCPLAKLLKKAGGKPVMEHLNPDRSIGWYPNEYGIMVTVRANSEDGEKQKAKEYNNKMSKKIFKEIYREVFGDI